jgi:hypothetical protein
MSLRATAVTFCILLMVVSTPAFGARFSGGAGGASGGPGDGYLEFDGYIDHGTFSSSLFDVGAAGTLSLWVAMDRYDRRNQFFEGPGNGTGGSSGDAAFEFQYRPNSDGQFFFYPNQQLDSNALVISSTNPPPQGEWFNLQYTWDINAGTNGKGHIYLNGEEVSYLTGYGSAFKNFSKPADTTNGIITVGADPRENRFFAGNMDDVAFYNRVLSKEELDSVRTSGAASVTLGQVVHWAMDDPIGSTTASDSSGNGIHMDIWPLRDHSVYAVEISSPSTASPASTGPGRELDISFVMTRDGVPLTENVSVLSVQINGRSCPMVVRQYTETFDGLSDDQPERTLLADGRLIVRTARDGSLHIDENGAAVMTSPDEYDGVIVNSTHGLPDTYLVSSDVKIIDFGITDRPENGFYWNAIMDERPVGPTHNSWTHWHRKVAIDIDNRSKNPQFENGIYILYYYDWGYNANKFWNGSEWVKDWVPACYYEDDAWYHTEIEKTETQYSIRIYGPDNVMMTEAVVPIADVVGGDEDWFYVGEPHTNNWYRGQAAVDNLTVMAAEHLVFYDPDSGLWHLTCTMPDTIDAINDLTLVVQYDGADGPVWMTLADSVLNAPPVPEPSALMILATALLVLSRRRR